MAPAPILTLADITLGFGTSPLLDGANLSINPGDRICLVGRNGSGKSTLLKVMAGLVEPDAGTRFLRPGMAVGYMEQDPDFSAYGTLGDYVRDGLDPADHFRADMAMEGVRLSPDIAPAAASGGERRRAALARLLSRDVDLMLLDEPTNHLDIGIISWLEGFLRDTRTAFVLISHDRAFLKNLTEATLWIDRGTVRRMEKGFAAFEDWRDKIHAEEDLERHKLDRLIKAEGRWAVEGISARRKRNMGRVRRLQDMRAERAAQVRRSGTAALAFDAAPGSGKLVAEAEHVTKAFGAKVILRDFSIRVMRGETVALVGENGSGKTTLLNILTGAEPPDSGRVRIGTGLLPVTFDQNRAALDPDKSLWDTLAQDPELGVSGKSDQVMVRGTPRHVVGYLKDFLFDETQARGPVSALSGGEKARLLLARLMARESNLLILDEPTNDLDVETLDLLQELVLDYGGTVLLVSHDRDFIDRVATTTVALEPGGRATVYAGGWSDMLAQRGDAGPVGSGQTVAPKPAPRKTAQTPKPDVSDTAARKVNRQQVDRIEKDMARVSAEIEKLETFLADPDLFSTAPEKFEKASAGLLERQERLAALEEQWLELEAGE
ncbi:ABC-F family ATP-binding cassette domain-containing protein [Oceanomicrobium pacificus]|uniref:ATP-binding cassette domain-containing protein n=1 Tax=Oceanomicrobium pacificus TaxID=2692916 RepID=A0A6B0TML3_9RHOB|nr:ATP-binding cassette domain-containing protein [Oceanomicrobium pacificus]MXU65810.1 ATP-binding cassette domain-containing protein [Oceanomicrobium pacificus]